MRPNLWKRLNRVEDSFCPNESKNGVVFIPLKDETNEDCEARIARWKAGQKVDGMDREYTGSEMIGVVRYVGSQAHQNVRTVKRTLG